MQFKLLDIWWVNMKINSSCVLLIAKRTLQMQCVNILLCLRTSNSGMWCLEELAYEDAAKQASETISGC